ncbi:zona pellucida sperm-binding protein 4-like [Xenentodon cancila]
MRLIYFCLLAVALHCHLTNAQWHQKPHDRPPQRPQVPKVPQWPQSPKGHLQPRVAQDPQRPQVPQDPQRPQVPKDPQRPQVPHQHEKNPVYNSCEVEEQYKIQCGLSTLTASECENINCCFDGHKCYYGRTVTLQCTKDGQFIVVVARDVTLPNIDLEAISFNGGGPNCEPVGSTSAFAIYQFPVTACGTVLMEEPGVLIYENRMSSVYEVAIGPRGPITRDSHYEVHVQCRYIGTSVEALLIEVGLVPPPPPVAAPGPLRVELRLGNGHCLVKGCNEDDAAFTSFYTNDDYPVTKVLREPVYVEIRLLERTDPNLVLTLGRCWATSSPYPQSIPQWDLLIDGCPYHDDRYLTQNIHVDASSGLMYPTHYRRFVFKMFTFVGHGGSQSPKKVPADPSLDPLKEKIYIHCDVAVCQPSNTNSCEPRCNRQKREIAASTKKLYREDATVVSSKEVVFIDASHE